MSRFHPQRQDGILLADSALRAARILGITQAELGAIVGRDRTGLQRGLLPESKAGQLAQLFLRCYRALEQLCDGDQQQMRHWMQSPNRATGGIPAGQLRDPLMLARITDYLEATSDGR